MENSQKRQREEPHEDSVSSDSELDRSKRQKPCNINNLLDKEKEEEPEPSDELSQDLSAIFTTFQQELSSSTSCDFESLPFTVDAEAAENSQKAECGGGDELDESVKSVMRHLLEASDDELGIPNARDENGIQNLNSTENLPFAFTDDDGLWEFEDVAANYSSVLQSELFM